MDRLLLILCLVLGGYCYDYIIPESTLEFLSPRGLKISIPDTDPDVTLVAFHLNINEEFYSVEHGQWAQDIIKPKNNRWTYIIPDFRVKWNDTVYYWVYAIRNGIGYQDLNRVYRVSQTHPHSANSVTKAPMTVAYTTEAAQLVATDMEVRDCNTSTLTSVRLTSVPCSGSEIFTATFHTNSDLDKWDHEVYIGGDRPDDQFTVFVNDRAVSNIIGDRLVIQPSLLEEVFPNVTVDGSLTLNACTSTSQELCSTQAFAYIILPPVVSARLTTKNSFSFRYGTIEIKAKLPKGDWIVPELWLEPKDEGEVGRIVLGLSRGNFRLAVADKSIASNLLETGVLVDPLLTDNFTFAFQKTQNNSWADVYHLFKLVWTPDTMEFWVDKEKIGQLAYKTDLYPLLGREKLAFFDKMFYITLGVHVGGSRDFPDTAESDKVPKPWKNFSPKDKATFWKDKNKWYPTWRDHSALLIESVKVIAL